MDWPSDRELLAALQDLDAKDVDLNPWETEFLESLLKRGPPFTEKQRAAAERLLEEHAGAEKSGEQETIRKLPPGAEKYFRPEESQ